MKIVVSLLTHNLFASGRKDLFDRTVASIRAQDFPHELIVLTNSSTDQTDKLVREMGGHVETKGDRRFFTGWNLGVTLAQERADSEDVILFTADDYEYRPGAFERLAAFWAGDVGKVILLSCDLEPDYPWNTATDTVESGGQRALIRDTVPGANMSFRPDDLMVIDGMPEGREPMCCRGCDHLLCARLRSNGYQLAAMDLAEHTGLKRSAGGNEGWQIAWPLDRERWGV